MCSSDLRDALALVERYGNRGSLIALSTEFGRPESGFERRQIADWGDLFQRYGLSILDPFLWFDFYYHGIVASRALLMSIGGYCADLPIGEDQDILLRACEAAGKDSVIFVDELGYRYRENPAGVCATQWAQVEKNYAKTMTEAMRRRGALFTDCRLKGKRKIGGAQIDEYEYRYEDRWFSWEDCDGRA